MPWLAYLLVVDIMGLHNCSSMMESTGSHGRGVERRLPEMRRMVEFNCTSTGLDQTGAQYSAAE